MLLERLRALSGQNKRLDISVRFEFTVFIIDACLGAECGWEPFLDRDLDIIEINISWIKILYLYSNNRYRSSNSTPWSTSTSSSVPSIIYDVGPV